MKVATVVGSRPQFVKLGPVSRVLRKKHQEILVYTGQHYDYALSDSFFAEFGLPKPDYNLQIGSESRETQTRRIA